jgi:hypothetical protein
MLIEPFLVAKVLLCWIFALPALALVFAGFAIWDKAISALEAAKGTPSFNVGGRRPTRSPKRDSADREVSLAATGSHARIAR